MSTLSGKNEEQDDDTTKLTKRDDLPLFRCPSPVHKVFKQSIKIILLGTLNQNILIGIIVLQTPKTEIQSGEVDGNEKRRERGTSWLDEEDDNDVYDGDGMNEIGNNMGSMTMEGEGREAVMVSAKEEPTINEKVRFRCLLNSYRFTYIYVNTSILFLIDFEKKNFRDQLTSRFLAVLLSFTCVSHLSQHTLYAIFYKHLGHGCCQRKREE